MASIPESKTQPETPPAGGPAAFVEWFRKSSPYIHAHRGRTFVIAFGGEAVADPGFAHIVHDVALLHSLGIRLVLVYGTRPQIERRLQQHGTEFHYVGGLRVTDDEALECVKEAAGAVRVEIEARLSMGLVNTPMAGARIRVASGNFVMAKPIGVRNGVDYGHTGEVRRVDAEGIRGQLDDGNIVLIAPLGYSPSGEIFNLYAEEVAAQVAVALGADKLLVLMEGDGIRETGGELRGQLGPQAAAEVLAGGRLDADTARHLEHALAAVRGGVRRAHLVSRLTDGALLLELFTRDGVGTLVTAEPYEGIRSAVIDDVGGILELIAPLEEQGVLVRRSREQLELEIDRFVVIERDGMVVACAALYPFDDEQVGEVACVVVHPDYARAGRGSALLDWMEREARRRGLRRLFVLTTHAPHWFLEHGFTPAALDDLPLQRRQLYNYRRNSKVFIKGL